MHEHEDHNDDRTPEELAEDRTAEIEWMSLASVFSAEDVEAMFKSEGLLAVSTKLALHVQLLTLKVAELDGRLAQEVRTRRLVVVDDEGVERVVAEVRPDYNDAVVEVTAGVDEGPTAALSASADDGEKSAALVISFGGNTAAQMYTTSVDGKPPIAGYFAEEKVDTCGLSRWTVD